MIFLRTVLGIVGVIFVVSAAGWDPGYLGGAGIGLCVAFIADAVWKSRP